MSRDWLAFPDDMDAHLRVDPALVWDTAVNKAPPLRAQLAEALREESSREGSES